MKKFLNTWKNSLTYFDFSLIFHPKFTIFINYEQKCKNAFFFMHDSLSMLKNSSCIILESSWVSWLKNGPSDHSEVSVYGLHLKKNLGIHFSIWIPKKNLELYLKNFFSHFEWTMREGLILKLLIKTFGPSKYNIILGVRVLGLVDWIRIHSFTQTSRI